MSLCRAAESKEFPSLIQITHATIEDLEGKIGIMKVKFEIDERIKNRIINCYITDKRPDFTFGLGLDYQHLLDLRERSFEFELSGNEPIEEIRIIATARDESKSYRMFTCDNMYVIGESPRICEYLPEDIRNRYVKNKDQKQQPGIRKL